MTKKPCLLIVSLVMLLGQRPCSAYHEDVHFNLTYVLCRLSGLPANDALWIAAADQSMDDNYSTTAYTGNPVGTKFKVNRRYNGLMWHDFCDDGCKPSTKNAFPPPSTISFAAPGDGGVKARQFIKGRYNQLWGRVNNTAIGSDDNSRIMADIALGQFLHYEQDFYSHRQFAKNKTADENQAQEENDDAYWPYGTKWGHAADGDGTTADQVKLRPYLAKKMISDCYDKIKQFAARRSISSPTETDSTLALIVDAISGAYGPRTFRSKTFGYTSYDFPTQTILNEKINSCLSSNHLFLYGLNRPYCPLMRAEPFGQHMAH